jgi:hypothetical protein
MEIKICARQSRHCELTGTKSARHQATHRLMKCHGPGFDVLILVELN